VGSFVPRAVLPVYLALMVLAFPIGWVISELLLRLIYYGIFTPLGLWFRVIGRDALRLRKPETDSYWTRRRQSADPLGYYRQA
jgi:polyferredoxin